MRLSVKKAPATSASRGKTVERRQHQVLCFGKGINSVHFGYGRIDIGVLHPPQPKEPPFYREVFTCQAVVGFGYCHHPLHHGRFRLAAQMGRRHDIGIAPQLHLLAVIEQDVIEAAGQHDAIIRMLLQKGGEAFFTNVAIRMMKQRQQFLAGDLPFRLFVRQAEKIAEGGGQFLKQLRESFPTGEILALEDLLDLFGEGIRCMRSQLTEIVRIGSDFRILEKRREALLVDMQDFQLEKDHFFAYRRPDLAHLGQHFPMPRLTAVAGEKKLGIEIRFEPLSLQLLIRFQRRNHQFRRKVFRGDTTAKIATKILPLLPDPRQIAFPEIILRAGVQERQIPGRII